MTGAVAKARDWLAELRRARDARDKDAFIDLLTAIALAAPGLQGAACEIARGFGDEDGIDGRSGLRVFLFPGFHNLR